MKRPPCSSKSLHKRATVSAWRLALSSLSKGLSPPSGRSFEREPPLKVFIEDHPVQGMPKWTHLTHRHRMSVSKASMVKRLSRSFTAMYFGSPSLLAELAAVLSLLEKASKDLADGIPAACHV